MTNLVFIRFIKVKKIENRVFDRDIRMLDQRFHELPQFMNASLQKNMSLFRGYL